MDFLVYCAALFAIYYVLNHSEILAKVRAALAPAVPPWIRKLFSCSFCLSFWLTFGVWAITPTGFGIILAAPVVVMFLSLVYDKLSK
jgi:hypothetical protein